MKLWLFYGVLQAQNHPGEGVNRWLIKYKCLGRYTNKGKHQNYIIGKLKFTIYVANNDSNSKKMEVDHPPNRGDTSLDCPLPSVCIFKKIFDRGDLVF